MGRKAGFPRPSDVWWAPPSLKNTVCLTAKLIHWSSELGLRQSLIFCDSFLKTNLTIPWKNWCFQYSVFWTLLCHFHTIASNSLNSSGADSCMFYMFSRTGDPGKWVPRPRAIGNNTKFLACATLGVSSKIFCGQVLRRYHLIQGPTRMISQALLWFLTVLRLS